MQFPLVGADFLRANKLLVDLDDQSVRMKGTTIKIPTSALSGSAIFASVGPPMPQQSPAQPSLHFILFTFSLYTIILFTFSLYTIIFHGSRLP